MKKAILAGVFGAFFATQFISWWPAPFAPIRNHHERLVFDDKAKQDFFATFEATFDAGNPMAELLDTISNTIVGNTGLANYYAYFSSALKK